MQGWFGCAWRLGGAAARPPLCSQTKAEGPRGRAGDTGGGSSSSLGRFFYALVKQSKQISFPAHRTVCALIILGKITQAILFALWAFIMQNPFGSMIHIVKQSTTSFRYLVAISWRIISRTLARFGTGQGPFTAQRGTGSTPAPLCECAIIRPVPAERKGKPKRWPVSVLA